VCFYNLTISPKLNPAGVRESSTGRRPGKDFLV
jgi:hypothetical protein